VQQTSSAMKLGTAKKTQISRGEKKMKQ